VPRYSTLDSRTIPDVSTHLGSFKLDIPIISAAMDSVTGKYMLVIMDRLGGLGILSRHIHLPDDKELELQRQELQWARDHGARFYGCAIGIRDGCLDKAKLLLDEGCSVICIDVAHGDHQKVYHTIDLLMLLKSKYQFVLMAGNVCTPAAVSKFAERGVDAIKVGIGPGAACTTRIVTGFGIPQLSAIRDAYSRVASDYPKTSIIADGGIRTSGDMVKCLWAGARACMVGYMLAGTSATPRIGGKKIYRGMSSRAASGRSDIAPEGIEIEMGDRGGTEELIDELVQGIRSGLAMGGVKDIPALRDFVDMVRVSPLSINESLPK
jgi:IMP dehydrogenase